MIRGFIGGKQANRQRPENKETLLKQQTPENKGTLLKQQT